MTANRATTVTGLENIRWAKDVLPFRSTGIGFDAMLIMKISQ